MTTENTSSNSEQLKKYKMNLFILFVIASIMIIIVFSIYFKNFTGDFSTENGDWGTFGDFIGGTLNPILAFLSFGALLMTIYIQLSELSETRFEIQQSRIAQESILQETAEQTKQSKIQTEEAIKQTKIAGLEKEIIAIKEIIIISENLISELNLKEIQGRLGITDKARLVGSNKNIKDGEFRINEIRKELKSLNIS